MNINKHPRESYFLKQHIASGEMGEGEKFEVDINITMQSYIFTFPEAIYTVGFRDILGEVMEFRKGGLADGEEEEAEAEADQQVIRGSEGGAP